MTEHEMREEIRKAMSLIDEAMSDTDAADEDKLVSAHTILARAARSGEPVKAYYDHPVMSDNGFPRAIRVDLFSPAERSIWAARGIVEEAGADPLLTDAVILLTDAQRKVAEYVDRQIMNRVSFFEAR